jgi:hypothetical protein
MRGAAITDDGWLADNPRVFRLLVDHAPPRPYGYFDQLRADAHDWRCGTLWLMIVALLGSAMYFQSPVSAAFGVWLLLFFILCCRAMVRSSRHCALRLGVLEALGRRHWLPGDYFKAYAWIGDETETPVLVARRLVADLLQEQGQAEVLMLYEPKQAYSIVIGARAVAAPEIEVGIRSSRDLPPSGSFRVR